MRRAAKLLPALAALFFLGACTTTEAATYGSTTDEFSWGLDINDQEGAKLVFGEPDTDNVWLGLYCRPGSARIDMIDFGGSNGSATRVTLVSGQSRTVAGVLAESDGMTGEMLHRAKLTADAPALKAFRQTGRLGFARKGAADAYSAATPAEKADIARFFTACGV
jgi:hypothetical protein